MAGGVHHLAVTVSDVSRAESAFYRPLLEALGFTKRQSQAPLSIWENDTADFRIHIFGDDEPVVKKAANAREPVDHVALRVDSRAALDARHDRLMSSGADILAPPSEMPQFGAGYYAMFVHDPDGRLVELVHAP